MGTLLHDQNPADVYTFVIFIFNIILWNYSNATKNYYRVSSTAKKVDA